MSFALISAGFAAIPDQARAATFDPFSPFDPLRATEVQSQAVTLQLPDISGNPSVVSESLSDNGSPVHVSDWTSVSLIRSGLSTGSHHTFTLTAYDASGNAASESISVWTAVSPVAGSFDTTPVSALPGGASGVGIEVDYDFGPFTSNPPTISGDGRYVAYVGAPISGYDARGNPLDAGGQPLDPTSGPLADDEVYLTDTLTGTTTLVTHQQGSASTPSDAPQPTSVVMSSNGRYVAYVASSSDLVTGTVPAGPNIYIYDRTTGTTTLVPTPAPVDTQDQVPAMSITGDGSRLLVVMVDPTASSYQNRTAAVIDWQTSNSPWVPTQIGLQQLEGAAISADGSAVAVGGYTSDFPMTTILDAGSHTQLAQEINYGVPLGFSADGQHLLLNTDVAPFGTPPLADWDRAQPDALAYFGGPLAHAFAGDGMHVTYSDAFSTPPQVYLGNLPSGTGTAPAPQDIGAGAMPVPSSDGSAVAYVNTVTDGSGHKRVAVLVAHPHDSSAPTWPGGAALSATNVTTTSVHLSWPAASDNVGVTAYVLTENGSALATLDGATTSYTVNGLSAGTGYTFAVRAKDAVGNTSAAVSTPVTTLSSGGITAGSDPLSATAKHGGIVSLSWDPAGGTIGGYRVMRDDGTGMHQVADLASATTAFDDPGRLAETSYTYRVDVLDTSNSPSPWTKNVSVTTPSITITKTSAAVPFLTGTSLARLGGEVQLRVEGEPNRTASAHLAFQSAGSGSSADVALTEGPAGVYTGTWTIPEGATSLTSVTGTLSDGVAAHDASAGAAGLPVEVSGAIAVTVDAPPAGSLTGSSLQVDGPAGFSATVAVDAPGTYPVPAPPGTGYDVRLNSTYGTVLGQQTVDVTAGTSTSVEFSPVLAASLVVTDTSAVLYGDQFTLTDAHGATLAEATTSGNTATFPAVAVGTQVTVTSTLPDAYAREWLQRTVQSTVTLAAGANDVTLSHPALPRATLTGTVTGPGGAPLHLATVSVSEHVGGWDETVAATTDSQGRYNLPALIGDATITTSLAGYFPTAGTQALPSGTTSYNVHLSDGTLTVHVLPPAGHHAGGVSVAIAQYGELEQTIDVPAGQTDAVFTGLYPNSDQSIRVTLDDPSRSIKRSYSAAATMDSPNVAVTVQETALGAGTLTGTVSAGGNPVANATIHATEYVDGRRWSYDATTGTDGSYSMSVVAGSLTVALTSGTPPGYDTPAERRVEVPADGTVTRDFVMPAIAFRTVHLALYTTDFGGRQSRQTLDWTTNYHFHTQLRDGAGGYLPVGDTVTIPSSAPSPLTFCANGTEAGLPRGCATVAFDKTQVEITVALHLTQLAGITGRVIGLDGTPATGSWHLLGRWLGPDPNVGSFSTFGAGAHLRQGLPSPGRWEFRVTGGQGSSQPVDVTVANGQLLDLGDIVLSTNHEVDPGASSVVASPDPVHPGQLLQVVATYTMRIGGRGRQDAPRRAVGHHDGDEQHHRERHTGQRHSR